MSYIIYVIASQLVLCDTCHASYVIYVTVGSSYRLYNIDSKQKQQHGQTSARRADRLIARAKLD